MLRSLVGSEMCIRDSYIGDPFLRLRRCQFCGFCVLPFSTLDLRSGRHKLPTVPPPRPYRRRTMVIHSPDQFRVQQTAAAAARNAANAAAGRADGGGDVPPAVLAAGADVSREVETDDLLGDATTVHDFDQWSGDVPPARRIQAEIHAAREEDDGINSNVTTRRCLLYTSPSPRDS